MTGRSSSDRDLQDSSAGSGVTALSDPLTFTVSGAHEATGNVTDAVGLTSDEAAATVSVDADPPTAALAGCPSTGSTPALVKLGAVVRSP